MHNDSDKIKPAFDIVDQLKDKLDEFSEEGAGGEERISKEMLEYINAELQNFTAAKMAHQSLGRKQYSIKRFQLIPNSKQYSNHFFSRFN